MKSYRTLALAIAIYMLAGRGEAKAYLDPAAGSMVLQVAVGGILAGAAAVRMCWKRLKNILRGDVEGRGRGGQRFKAAPDSVVPGE